MKEVKAENKRGVTVVLQQNRQLTPHEFC